MRMLEPTGWHELPTVRQFIKYGLVGASNTIVNFVVYSVGVTIGIHYLIALVIGYAVGSLNSYILNRHWTFQARNIAHTTAGSRFALVTVCAIAANLGLLYVFVHHLGISKIPAQAILTLPLLAVTFPINRWWSFAHPGGRDEPPSAVS
jgi:putative flippase GtrA